MKHRAIQWKFYLSLLGFLLLALSGCAEDPTGPGDPTDPGFTANSEIRTAAQLGWQTLHQADTQQQFSEMLAGQEVFVNDEGGMINSMPEVRREAQTLGRLRNYAAQSAHLGKTSGDSLVWFEEWTDPVSGTSGRRALFYNDSSGYGRFYETIYQFPPLVQLRYDSTEIHAYLGPSLADTTDDQLRSLDKLSRFREDFYIQEVASNVTALAYDELNQIVSASADNRVTYGGQIELLELNQHAEFYEGADSFFEEILHYRDNTTLQKNITFHPNQTGTFSETWRDGSTVSGSFDLFEDDNHGAVSRTVNFAHHPLVSQLVQQAEFTYDPADSSSSTAISEVYRYRAGGADSVAVGVERRFEEGYWKEYFNVRNSREGESSFTVTYFDSYKEIEGEHTDRDGLFYLFNGIEYEDGSGELWVKVYASREAYLNNEPPILTLHIVYHPDGSGSGELVYDGQTYQVRYTAGGEIEVVDEVGQRDRFSSIGGN